MTDIVERLRVWPAAYGEDSLSLTYVGWVMKQAADEIERLRATASGADAQGMARRDPALVAAVKHPHFDSGAANAQRGHFS